MNKETSPQKSEQERVLVEIDSSDRLDAWLADRLKLSRTRVASLIADARVVLNGKPVRKSYRPRAGDVLLVDLPPLPILSVEPEPIRVPVVFEDDVLLVVDKPAGLVVHPAPGHPSGTLVNALLARTDRLSTIGSPLRPGIVHRLDRDTSGLMVVAKDEAAHRSLSRAISARAVGRGYIAAAWGGLEPERLTIDRPIGRHPRDRKRMAVVESGRRAITHVQRLERFAAADLLALRLHTGRTHQIRVHLQDAGHPVVGDPTYGRDWQKGFTGAGGRWAEEFARRAGRLFLHAARLTFSHPLTAERLVFTSPLPDQLGAAVEWARASGSR
ncbi:MAG: RluA family pseudouridine synthase [Gemmatimonadota bacterium]